MCGCWLWNSRGWGSYNIAIIDFMGHDLAIIVVRNFLFIVLYGIDTNVIHLIVLFEHQCLVHCLNTNVTCMFILLFRHGCCMYIHIVYTWKSCTQLLCLNNARHSCLNDTNPWNNIFHMDLEQTHETYKFVMACNEVQNGLDDYVYQILDYQFVVVVIAKYLLVYVLSVKILINSSYHLWLNFRGKWLYTSMFYWCEKCYVYNNLYYPWLLLCQHCMSFVKDIYFQVCDKGVFG